MSGKYLTNGGASWDPARCAYVRATADQQRNQQISFAPATPLTTSFFPFFSAT
ncbi:hypothetical protein QT349_21200 [Escherichia coli]|nr:hypothetical protein [Escherichia coli]